jgi:hypothetical protein
MSSGSNAAPGTSPATVQKQVDWMTKAEEEVRVRMSFPFSLRLLSDSYAPCLACCHPTHRVRRRRTTT